MAADVTPRPAQIKGIISAERAILRAITILAVLGIVSALYYGRALFIPLAVAILLTFVLAPLVRLFRRWGAGRVPSVIIVVVFAFTIIFGSAALLGQQLTQLAERLPQYQFNIQNKVRNLQEAATHGGTFSRVADFLHRLNSEMANRGTPVTPAVQAPGQDVKPAPVEIHQPPSTPIEVIRGVLDPLLEPLTTVGVVVIFVIFFLFQREDLRDRLIKLAGSHDLRRTTEAINDAARRLSRYFLAQTSLNVVFGVIVTIGLAVIGVPNPVLWGIMAAMLRFVPYVGAFIAAAFPIALSVAVDPGWTMVLWTVVLFVVVEPLIGQVAEPLVYGRSTGISAVAVVVAATFWTWLWGPIGLLLSTPLTVCLGVLGRHIEWLRFVDVMIGDDPPLTPAQSFYQRALAGDFNDGIAQAESYLKHHSLIRYYDQVVLQALLLAQIDVRRGTLDDRHIEQIRDVAIRLIADLADHVDEPPAITHRPDRKDPSPSDSEEEEAVFRHEEPPDNDSLPVLLPGDMPDNWAGKVVLCIGGPGPFDDVATTILAQLLEKHGIGARSEDDSTMSALNIARADTDDVGMICLSYLYLGYTPVHLGYSIRRFRRTMPGRKIVAGLWCHEQGGNVGSELANDATAMPQSLATTLEQAVRLCIATITSREDETADAKLESSAA
jgi:predicted PurR-regulated permease PerM